MRKKLLLMAAAACLCVPFLAAQQSGWIYRDTVPGKHRGAVIGLFQIENEIFSIDADGYLVVWNTPELRAATRFQLTPFKVTAVVKHPDRDEICLVEKDELGLNRISVWNCRTMKKLFSRRLNEPAGFVNYSAGGNFIIAALTGISGFVFVNSQTGELLKSPEALSASIAFAATGRSERAMISYFSSGILSYWDLLSGEQTSRFEVPPNLASAVIFGNNRYFAGVDSNGITVLDAVSGSVLDRNRSMPANSALSVASDDLYCLVRQGERAGIYQFSINRNGRLAEKNFYRVTERTVEPGHTDGEPAIDDFSARNSQISAFSIGANFIALGTSDGDVILYYKDGSRKAMSVNKQTSIIAAAVSDSQIAFLTADGRLGFLPADYTGFAGMDTFKLNTYGAYTKISPLYTGSGAPGQFLLWQTGDTRLLPCIVSADTTDAAQIKGLSLKFPLRSAQAYNRKLLLLDTAGNLSVVPIEGTAAGFSFFSAGSMDAVFTAANYVLLCRSAVSGNAPFLLINIVTGETVPLALQANAGILAYRSSGGNIYAAIIGDTDNKTDTPAIIEEEQGLGTSIIRLNTATPAISEKIAEYPGENTHFSLAEAESLVAATIGGEGACIYGKDEIIPFERTPGLPAELIGAGKFFITLDTDGNIAWHSARTGSLLAVFQLFAGEWVLQTPARTIRNRAE